MGLVMAVTEEGGEEMGEGTVEGLEEMEEEGTLEEGMVEEDSKSSPDVIEDEDRSNNALCTCKVSSHVSLEYTHMFTRSI